MHAAIMHIGDKPGGLKPLNVQRPFELGKYCFSNAFIDDLQHCVFNDLRQFILQHNLLYSSQVYAFGAPVANEANSFSVRSFSEQNINSNPFARLVTRSINPCLD